MTYIKKLSCDKESLSSISEVKSKLSKSFVASLKTFDFFFKEFTLSCTFICDEYFQIYIFLLGHRNHDFHCHYHDYVFILFIYIFSYKIVFIFVASIRSTCLNIFIKNIKNYVIITDVTLPR